MSDDPHKEAFDRWVRMQPIRNDEPEVTIEALLRQKDESLREFYSSKPKGST